MRKRKRFATRFLYGYLTLERVVDLVIVAVLFIPCLFAAAIAAAILF